MDKSGARYAAAVRTPNGCLLCQKAPNREVSTTQSQTPNNADHVSTQRNGYIQIAPVADLTIRTRAGKGATKKVKPLPQSGHRLAVMAFKEEEDIRHLLDDGWHASHLCGRTTCIEPGHLVVEPKDRNEARKDCRDFVSTQQPKHLVDHL